MMGKETQWASYQDHRCNGAYRKPCQVDHCFAGRGECKNRQYCQQVAESGKSMNDADPHGSEAPLLYWFVVQMRMHVVIFMVMRMDMCVSIWLLMKMQM